MAKIFIENYSKEINIKNIDNNGFNIFDYAFKDGASLIDECIDFINSMFKIYEKDLDKSFLSSYTRYGRNSLLNLCEDYALHIYEKFYDINKNNSISFIRKNPEKENSRYNKYYIPKKYIQQIFEMSVKDLHEFINKKFYPLIEEFIKKGCDINCCHRGKKICE